MEIVLINEDQFQGPGPAGFSSVTSKLLQSEYQNPSITILIQKLEFVYGAKRFDWINFYDLFQPLYHGGDPC